MEDRFFSIQFYLYRGIRMAPILSLFDSPILNFLHIIFISLKVGCLMEFGNTIYNFLKKAKQANKRRKSTKRRKKR